MTKSKTSFAIIPVMLCFFCMGFVDLVGIASNYVKEDFHLSDSVANIFPSLVFFWFLIFSVPTGILMNRIGRKNTVLLSLLVTIVSLLLPILGNSFTVMLVAFSFLGIGNALMQTSLNPLVSTVVQGGNLASTLTFGQTYGFFHHFDRLSISRASSEPLVITVEGSVIYFNQQSGIILCCLLPVAGHSRGAPLVPGYYMPRGYRRGHQHHCPKNLDGATANTAQ